MDFSTLGNKIRQLRKENNLTQETLAEQIDLSYTYLGQVERGERGINIPNLIKIANRFNISIDNYLLSDYLDNAAARNDSDLDNEMLLLIENKSPTEKQKIIALVKDIIKHF